MSQFASSRNLHEQFLNPLVDDRNKVGSRSVDAAGDSDFGTLLKTLKPHPPETALILAGGMTRERAQQLIDAEVIDLAAFGAPFISNPDLVARLQNGWPLAEADRATFYGGDAKGYIDYPSYRPAA